MKTTVFMCKIDQRNSFLTSLASLINGTAKNQLNIKIKHINKSLVMIFDFYFLKNTMLIIYFFSFQMKQKNLSKLIVKKNSLLVTK